MQNGYKQFSSVFQAGERKRGERREREREREKQGEENARQFDNRCKPTQEGGDVTRSVFFSF